MSDMGAIEKNFATFLQEWAPFRKFRERIADDLANRARAAQELF